MSSYYGRSADNISNVIKLDNITFNGGTTYALTQNGVAFVPNNSSSLLISIDGVVQQGNFTVNSSNIVFNFSPTSSNTCNWILHIGVGVAYVPAASSITKDKTDFVSTSSSSGITSKGDGGSVDGSIALNCSQNSHHTRISSASHSSYSGNLNFVLPSSHGSNGQFMKTDGSGNLSFASAGGLTDADYWNFGNNQTISAATETTVSGHWNKQTAYGGAGGEMGSGLSESSGVFSFPTTGIYYVKGWFRLLRDGDSRYNNLALEVTLNNSSYNTLSYGSGFIKQSGGSTTAQVNVEALIDVTDTSNVKFRFRFTTQNEVTINGAAYSMSGLVSMKIGDT